MGIQNTPIPLNKVPVGMRAKVISLSLDGVMRRRLMDLGFVPNSELRVLRKSPAGDPIAYEVKGAVYGLRKEESEQIWVEIIDEGI